MPVKTEGFEGLNAGANIPFSGTFTGFLVPGSVSVFQFASGLRLIDPIPNGNNVLIGDFALSPLVTWGLGTSSVDDAGDVAFGSAYLGRNDPSGGMTTFSFNEDVYLVGAYVTGVDGSHNRIAAYDASGRLISAASIRSVIVADWDTNYIQVMSKKPIAKVVFTGDFQIIDNVQFDTSKLEIIKGSKFGGKVNGTNSDDLILGKKGSESIKGKGGDDTIEGKGGNDKIKGGDGNDFLSDGKGKNKLWGDAGQDSFLFRTTQTDDTLKDFNPLDDTILLAKAAFGILPLGQLSVAAFHIGAAATDANQRIIYDSGTGDLFYDQDGNGGIGAVKIAKLPTGLALTEADFFVA
jgi:Ca2+-binding RTX toxin-like protein